MGEHRISFKIEFSMHGHNNKWDAWLNWSDDLPDELKDWFEKQYDKAMKNYWNDVYKLENVAEAYKENEERNLLAQLKEKYEKE